MKTFTNYLWMNTKKQKEIVNITALARNRETKVNTKFEIRNSKQTLNLNTYTRNIWNLVSLD